MKNYCSLCFLLFISLKSLFMDNEQCQTRVQEKKKEKKKLNVNTKFPNCRKSNIWKEIWFANINLYLWIMSTISISILLQKNTLWFYILWTWLKQEIFSTLDGRWIEWSSQQISNFELIRDLLFFKSLNVKARRLKFFEALKAWSVELQRFGFVEVYGGFLA